MTARLSHLLEAIVEALPGSAAQPPAPGVRLRLVSALAEGADRLGAAAALERGAALHAVLPFPAAEYACDFVEEGSREAFEQLLGRAEATLVLDGAADARDKAYDAAGRALLDNCDLLIAVWDGGPGRGRGGTQDVIEEAARRGMPIVTVRPDGEAVAVRNAGAVDPGSMRLEDIPESPIEELPDLVRQITAWEDGGEPDWLSEPMPPADGWMYAAYPLLLRLAGAGSKKAGQGGLPPASALHAAFEWWDGIAISAARAFRSAVIVNFTLAAIAVLLAAFSVLVDETKWIFVLAEIVTLVLLLANNWYAGRRKWQERWLESREVAELLRVVLLLRDVGIGRIVAEPAGRDWSDRYAWSLARAGSPQSLDLSDPQKAAEPVVAEVLGQARWNEATGGRMHKVARRIERFGELLLVAVLGLAIGWLILRIADARAAASLKYLLTALTAGLPAVATASYGIRVILDFEGIAGRAHHLASELQAALDGWRASTPGAATLQHLGRQSAEVMLGDVASWRILAEGRRLAVPG